MVRQSNDGSGTELSHWFRDRVNELPSVRSDLPKYCDPYIEPLFTLHNLDYIICCYQGHNAKKWMLLEEKRYNSDMRFAQSQTFETIEAACSVDTNFQGFHLIQLENTTPDNGRVWIDQKEVTRDEFITFLQFEDRPCRYKPYFDNTKTAFETLIRRRIKGRKPGTTTPIRIVPVDQKQLFRG